MGWPVTTTRSPIVGRSHRPASVQPGWVASHPLEFATIAGGAGVFFTLSLVFAPEVDTLAWLWSLGQGAAFGVAGWAVSLGRRVGRRRLVVLGIATMASTSAITQLEFVSGLLERVGANPDRRYGWAWVDLGDATVTTLSVIGMLVTLSLGAVAGVLAWRARQHPATRPPRPRPLAVGVLVGVIPVLLAVGEGYDAALTPFLVAYGLVIGIGAAAISIGAHRRRRTLIATGWIAVGALPVLHAIGMLTPVDGWAPTMVHDVFGVLLSLTGALFAATGLLRIGWATHRAAVHAAAGGGADPR